MRACVLRCLTVDYETRAVIAGLDPAIHLAKRSFIFLMDARVKPAHDELRITTTLRTTAS
jgi:hypothetical protein